MYEDPFFSLPDSSEWNALVGEQGDPIFYAEGYIEAALELAKLVVEKRLYAQRDTLVMPMLYNARHSIELHLKLFIADFIKVGLLTAGHPVDHNIASHFALLENRQIPDEAYRGLLAKLKPFVESLARIDDDGQEFRYFENRDGHQSLGDHALANIAVIGKSLDDLKAVLTDLKYRTWSLCDEFRTGTHTNYLSRSDLFSIAKIVPQRSQWTDQKFDDAREEVKQRFSIGNRQFSLALNKIQETRELKADLGVETPLLHLSDDTAIFLAEQWKIIHPPKEPSELGTSITCFSDFEKLFENDEAEKQALERICTELSENEIADAETIFYLARDNVFSEYYERMLESKKAEYKASGNIPQEAYDLMQKTNFLEMFEKGARRLGRLTLAGKLQAMK
jgi:hypothetical protein